MKSTYCEYIFEKILSTSEVGPILALIAPSPFISLLSVDIEWHGRNESCWPKWPENINWPSGPIFVQFDWPDRKYTGHGPAVASTPALVFVPPLWVLNSHHWYAVAPIALPYVQHPRPLSHICYIYSENILSIVSWESYDFNVLIVLFFKLYNTCIFHMNIMLTWFI